MSSQRINLTTATPTHPGRISTIRLISQAVTGPPGADGAGVSVATKEGGTQVVAVTTALDFLGADFNVTESPSGEANVSLAVTPDPAGTASTAVSNHVAAGDPHTQYALESALGTAAYTASTAYATAAQGATADAALPKALYDAHSILYATTDDTPVALTVGASTIVGRKASGNIVALSGSEAATIVGLPTQAEFMTIAVGDETTAITTGTAKVTWRMPFAFTLTAVRASLTTASSSGTPTVDINEGGTSVLSTKLTIDANELTSTSAATAAVISDAAIADDALMTIDIDTAGTGAAGLKVTLYGTRA